MIRILSFADFKIPERGQGLTDTISAEVAAIISEVRANGDQALFDFTRKFDRVQLERLRVEPGKIREAEEKLPLRMRNVLELAIRNIQEFHSRTGLSSWENTSPDGTRLGVKVTPIPRVGLYIPGGKAAYPSTLLMNVIPARIAGVSSIAVFSPPGPSGLPNSDVMAACSLLGIDEVYSIGGAHSVAAMAYGTESVARVNKICGPGNAYVAEAKRQVFGQVGIDSVAGPSEILILHDDLKIPAEFTARDLLSQAEHDENAMAILVTTSAEYARQVAEIIEKILPDSPRRKIIEASLKNNGVIYICENLDQGLEIVNSIAPEHLELFCTDKTVVDRVNNAGAIFIGKWSSEPIGDYIAGPNHTIPTSGAAMFHSPLSVRDFQKTSSVIEYSEKLFNEHAESAAYFADSEGLPAHAAALRCRLD